MQMLIQTSSHFRIHWPIVFSVLTLNVASLSDFLHLSRFVLDLGSMSVLLDNAVKVMSSVVCVSFLSVLRVM